MEYLKAILFGIVGSIVFMCFTQFGGSWVGDLFFRGGDAYELSYHLFSRMGIVGISGIIITSTIIIVKKLNKIIDLLAETDKK